MLLAFTVLAGCATATPEPTVVIEAVKSGLAETTVTVSITAGPGVCLLGVGTESGQRVRPHPFVDRSCVLVARLGGRWAPFREFEPQAGPEVLCLASRQTIRRELVLPHPVGHWHPIYGLKSEFRTTLPARPTGFRVEVGYADPSVVPPTGNVWTLESWSTLDHQRLALATAPLPPEMEFGDAPDCVPGSPFLGEFL